jgi:hypothetical protein
VDWIHVNQDYETSGYIKGEEFLTWMSFPRSLLHGAGYLFIQLFLYVTQNKNILYTEGNKENPQFGALPLHQMLGHLLH